MEPSKQFARCVRNALVNLYDPAHMEVHPLLSMLALEDSLAGTRARALRELLVAAVELLQPREDLPYGDPAWIGYRILRGRYIEASHPREVCASLGLSRTTFYRYHREALDALIHILWRQHTRDAPSTDTALELSLSNENAVAEALRVARSSQAQRLDVLGFMRGMQEMIGLVASRASGEITIDLPEALPSVGCNATALRQIVLSLVAEIYRLAPSAIAHLTLYADRDSIVWSLTGSGLSPLQPKLESSPGVQISRALLEIYGGSLWFEIGARRVLNGIRFRLPVIPQNTILVIDDNPDLTALYTRFLLERDCIVYQAHSAKDAERWLTQIRPDLILLDVLMPDEDGWLVLRKLKETPDTADIPVVICSVLDQPDLAIALGAEAVLQKPVIQESLLGLVDELLALQQA